MMSCDHDEPMERPSEPTEQLESEINGSPQSKKLHGDGPNEHAKPKRRGRRGKKRKQRKGGGAPCPVEHQEECEAEHSAECEKHCLSWDSEEEDIEVEDYHPFNNVMIRPIDVPKAPENSTQFIIDDHDESHLYMSFETPNPYLANYLRGEEDDSEIIEPDGEDAAYVDINYEYESPHDFDNSAYYDREFELSYKNNRFDELLRLPRNDLVSGLRNLENHLKELNEDLVKEDPDPILERLQTELLELQEKHLMLKEQNASLRAYLVESGVDHPSLVEEHSEATSEEQLNIDDFVKREVTYECRTDLHEYPENQESQLVMPYSGESVVEQTGEQSVLCNQKQDEDSPRHVSRVDASNKENACYDEITFEERLKTSKCTARKESCHVGSMDSCSEHIPVKEKAILRDSEYHESQPCEEMPLNSVPEEHELSAVTV